MILKIYDYDNAVKEITVPDKEIREIVVHVLSGDETGFVEFTDGEKVYFDASDCRLHGFDDGLYIVHGKAIQKWINFQPSGDRTVSYERMDAFFDNEVEDEDPVEDPQPPVKDMGQQVAETIADMTKKILALADENGEDRNKTMKRVLSTMLQVVPITDFSNWQIGGDQ